MSLFESLKSNALLIACVILTIMLLIKTNEVGSLQTALTHCNSEVIKFTEMSDRLSKQVKDLGQQLDNNSKNIPKIVRNVDVVICDTKVKQEAIKNIPSNNKEVIKGGGDGISNEGNTAGIDDKLPPELIGLLQ